MKSEVTLTELALKNGFVKVGKLDGDEVNMKKGDVEIYVHNWHSGGYIGVKQSDETYHYFYVSDAEDFLNGKK